MMHQPVFDSGCDLLMEEPEAEPTPAMVSLMGRLYAFDAYRYFGEGEHGRAPAGITTIAEQGALVVAAAGARLDLYRGAMAVLEPRSQVHVRAGGIALACEQALVLADSDAIVYTHPRCLVISEPGARLLKSACRA